MDADGRWKDVPEGWGAKEAYAGESPLIYLPSHDPDSGARLVGKVTV